MIPKSLEAYDPHLHLPGMVLVLMVGGTSTFTCKPIGVPRFGGCAHTFTCKPIGVSLESGVELLFFHCISQHLVGIRKENTADT